MDYSTPGFPVLHHLLKLAQTDVHWVSDAIQPPHPLLPLLLLPSVFPSIRAFSNKSSLHIRWPKYWSFSFSISLSSEYSGLISKAALHSTLKSYNWNCKIISDMEQYSWYILFKIISWKQFSLKIHIYNWWERSLKNYTIMLMLFISGW